MKKNVQLKLITFQRCESVSLNAPRVRRAWLSVIAIGACVVLIGSCADSAADVVRHKNAGDNAYVHGKYAEAEREYQAALKKAERVDGNDILTLICLRSLAQVYVAQGKMGEAESIYKKRIELLQVPANDPVYASSVYDDLATFYILNGKPGEAKPIYQQAIALSEIGYGAEDPKVVEKLQYYVELLKARNYETEALELQTKATAIKEKRSGI